ncbi:hypothetical protein GCM10007160_27360 [Litchfieldella qijiaojingensis]|uniref:Uncharacterized protein n=1 Tax=Litchfieldella qijiaojingensis TaxID=980347 RepID=A0ABQ2YX94_9GAMM|nr:hypothetical protein GCM10007160_27360 [Halomonas qijiaojingensis]
MLTPIEFGATAGRGNHAGPRIVGSRQGCLDPFDGRVIMQPGQQKTDADFGIDILGGPFEDLWQVVLELFQNPGKLPSIHRLLIITAGGDHEVGHAIDLVAILLLRQHGITLGRILRTEGRDHLVTQVLDTELMQVMDDVRYLRGIDRHHIRIGKKGSEIHRRQIIQRPLAIDQPVIIQQTIVVELRQPKQQIASEGDFAPFTKHPFASTLLGGTRGVVGDHFPTA